MGGGSPERDDLGLVHLENGAIIDVTDVVALGDHDQVRTGDQVDDADDAEDRSRFDDLRIRLADVI